ncbi:choice-of-anchor D domain-containing protein [candidate division KSB1 bacterium]|nr:choice-of-anchor D domain-containing protein [candidate division KSB1 bacterium]
MRFKYILWIFCIIPGLLLAQYADWENYTNGDEITAIAQEGGTLWIGTTGGLVKLDTTTRTAEHFNKTNSGLPMLDISAVKVDSLGNKWIGTMGAGLVLYDDATWTVFDSTNSGIPHDAILALELGAEHQPLVGTIYGLGARNQDGTWTVYNTVNSNLPYNQVNAIAYNPPDSVTWIGTEGGGLWETNGSTIDNVYNNAPPAYLPSNFISAVAIDTSGRPWIGTNGNGVAYNSVLAGWQIYNTGNSSIPSDNITCLGIDVSNNPVIGTQSSGVSEFQITSWVTTDTSNSNIPSNNISFLFLDDQQVPWVGTNDEGVARINGINFDTNYNNTSQSGIANNNLSLLAPTTTAGQMWSFSRSQVTFENALSFYNGTIWQTHTPSNSPLPADQIKDIHVVGGTLRFFTEGGGAGTFDGLTTWNIENTGNSSIPDNYCVCADVDNDGVVWVGTYSGLGYNDKGLWRVYNTGNSTIPNNFIVAVAATDSSNIWAASEGAGPELYHYNGTAWTTYTTVEGLPAGFIQDITLDPLGFPYIGMTTGLVHFDGTTFRHWTSANSLLLNNNVDDVYVETDGTIWASTPWGVMERSATDSVFHHFNNSGLPGNGVRAVNQDPDGNFWFASTNGLAKYNAGPALEPALTITPGTLNFGTELVGSSTNLTSVLTNTGDTNLEIFQIIETGTDTASFSHAINTPTTWTPGLSTNLNVTFSPFTEGAKQAFYIFISNAPSSPDTLTVQGNAQFPSPEFSTNKNALAYGEISLGVTTPDTLIVTNTGNDTLKLENPEIFGPNANRFAIASGGGTVDLLPDQSRQLILNFTPAAEQEYSAFLVFFSNADTSPDSIPLSGTGIFAFPELTKSTSTLDFGTMNINVEANVSIRLESTGQLAVEDITVTLEQGVDSVYSTSSIPVTLDPGSSVNLGVSFTPLAAITYPALIVITSNAPSSPDSIAITGTGREVALSLEPYGLEFGTVQVDSSTTRSFWMKNNSYSSIQIIRSFFRPLLENAVYSVVGDVPRQLPALDSLLITLRFSPRQNETDSAAFIIESTANSSPDSVYLRGTGQSMTFEFPEPPAPPAGEDFSLTFTVDPPIPGITIWVHYIQTGSTVWDSIACEYEEPNYNAILPESILSLRGLVYYMSVEDSTGAPIYQNGSPDAPAAFIPVTVEEEVSPVVPEEETYTLISVPCTLGDDRIMEVLRDDLGVQSAKSWRMFYWDPVDSVYDEFDPIRDALDWTFTPGIAYWLITRNGSRLTIENGESTNGLDPFSITLLSGWNQIGNPFAFRVRWSDVINTDMLQLVGRTGTSYTYNNTVLEPWTGYFVYNPYEVRTIQIPPVEAVTTTPKSLDTQLADGEFTVRISAHGLTSDYLDDQNFAGMKTSAKNGFDANDFFEAPPIGDPVSLSIVDGKINYAGNFRQSNDKGTFWDLALMVTDKAETVRLSLEWAGQMAEGFDTWLLDRDRECLIPLRDNMAEIQMSGSNSIKSLRLIVGSESYAGNVNEGIPLIPYEFTLMQNYPNPFNPETQIQYHLKEKSSVRLTIYNVRGQRIRTLAHGIESTGPHHVTWDSRNDNGLSVPSGIYIFRLETPTYNNSKKMILVR